MVVKHVLLNCLFTIQVRIFFQHKTAKYCHRKRKRNPLFKPFQAGDAVSENCATYTHFGSFSLYVRYEVMISLASRQMVFNCTFNVTFSNITVQKIDIISCASTFCRHSRKLTFAFPFLSSTSVQPEGCMPRLTICWSNAC